MIPDKLRKRLPYAVLALAIGAALLTARRDEGSAVAGLLRARAPVAGLVWVRGRDQGRVVPPSVYIPLYIPAARRLEIIAVDPSSLAEVYAAAYADGGDVARASRAMADEAMRALSSQRAWPPGDPAPAFRLELTLPRTPAGTDLEAVKSRLTAWCLDPWFWPRMALRLAPGPQQEAPGLSRYDALLLAWTLRRQDPARIALSLLPAPALAGPFLAERLSPARPRLEGPVTVEVLNSSGSGGVASRATKVLRWQGIDVVHFGNTRDKKSATQVLDRVGLPAGAQAVLDALGCPRTEILTEMERAPAAQVTLVLGVDFGRCSNLRQ